MYIHDTGWSKVTVTSNFSLVSLKITTNGKTQPFLESLYATILIFQCLSRVRWKSFAFQDCAWIVILLHTERTENPHTPKTHSSASNFCKYPSDIPQISLRHPQTSPRQAYGISSEHKTLTDANRHRQTLTGAFGVCLAVSIGVCCCPFACRVPWRCLWDVCEMSCGFLGVSGGIWVVFMEIWGARMYLVGIWVLRPCSMEL